jgi:hypothetical protein
MGTACRTASESQCDASGNRCFCEFGIWYCNNACPATEPTPATGCERGAYCNYAPGATCQCVDDRPCNGPDCPWYGDSAPPDPPPRWICIGTSSCPADPPTSGQDCTGLTDTVCDYPNPALHRFCDCMANIDPASGSTWSCGQSAPCPATQPPYAWPVGATCMGPAICTYATPPYHCRCPVMGGTGIWVCL